MAQQCLIRLIEQYGFTETEIAGLLSLQTNIVRRWVAGERKIAKRAFQIALDHLETVCEMLSTRLSVEEIHHWLHSSNPHLDEYRTPEWQFSMHPRQTFFAAAELKVAETAGKFVADPTEPIPVEVYQEAKDFYWLRTYLDSCTQLYRWTKSRFESEVVNGELYLAKDLPEDRTAPFYEEVFDINRSSAWTFLNAAGVRIFVSKELAESYRDKASRIAYKYVERIGFYDHDAWQMGRILFRDLNYALRLTAVGHLVCNWELRREPSLDERVLTHALSLRS